MAREVARHCSEGTRVDVLEPGLQGSDIDSALEGWAGNLVMTVAPTDNCYVSV